MLNLLGRIAAATLAIGLALTAVACHRTLPHAAEDEPEHHIPPHKPANLAIAAAELKRRLASLGDSPAEPAASAPAKPAPEKSTPQTSPADDPEKSAVEEYRDIIGWLPELAAETDLKKPAWDRVAAASVELAAIFSPSAAQESTARNSPLSPADRERAAAILDQLTQLAAQSSAGQSLSNAQGSK